jgi:hypothetical protein
MWTSRSGLLPCTCSSVPCGAWHHRRTEHREAVVTVDTIHSAGRGTPTHPSGAQNHQPTLHELYNKYINVYNIYSYAYIYKYILYILFIYIYTQRHVRPCESSNDRTPAWPADMSIPAETLGFLASLTLEGDSRSLSGSLGTRLLFLCFGEVGIDYSLPTKKNSNSR